MRNRGYKVNIVQSAINEIVTKYKENLLQYKEKTNKSRVSLATNICLLCKHNPNTDSFISPITGRAYKI